MSADHDRAVGAAALGVGDDVGRGLLDHLDNRVDVDDQALPDEAGQLGTGRERHVQHRDGELRRVEGAEDQVGPALLALSTAVTAAVTVPPPENSM